MISGKRSLPNCHELLPLRLNSAIRFVVIVVGHLASLACELAALLGLIGPPAPP